MGCPNPFSLWIPWRISHGLRDPGRFMVPPLAADGEAAHEMVQMVHNHGPMSMIHGI